MKGNNEMKKDTKEFEMPKADVILFESEDVITTSGGDNETPAMPYSMEY